MRISKPAFCSPLLRFSSSLVGLLVLGSAVSWASPAQADEALWSTPATGLTLLDFTSADQHMTLLFVDLCAAGISLRATADGERGRKTSSFGALVGAQAAINGDFFGGGYNTDGIAMSGGAQWGLGQDHSYVTPIAFGQNRVSIPFHGEETGPEGWMREVVSGHPSLLVGGVHQDNNGDAGLCLNRHPRTAIGLSADRKTLLLAVVDGRRANRIGMTCDELSGLMAFWGITDAVNLDGGGSSTMWIAGRGVVNFPSDSSGERTVGNHLAVYATGGGEPMACPQPRYRAQFVGFEGFPSTDFSLVVGTTASGCLLYQNTGALPWVVGQTNLGTTLGRDVPSVLYASDWLNDHRLATVQQNTNPGEVGRFCFSLRAPDVAGVYTQTFNLVHEAVAWFSDSGGPSDDVNWMRITAIPPPPDNPVDMPVDMPVDTPTDTPDAGANNNDAGSTGNTGNTEDAGNVVGDPAVFLPPSIEDGCGVVGLDRNTAATTNTHTNTQPNVTIWSLALLTAFVSKTRRHSSCPKGRSA